MIQYELYLGGRDKHGLIEQESIDSFIKNDIGILFDSYSVYRIQGSWQGTSEPSTVVRIVVSDAEYGVNYDLTRNKLAFIADQYCRDFDQDSVLLTSAQVDSQLLTQYEVNKP